MRKRYPAPLAVCLEARSLSLRLVQVLTGERNWYLHPMLLCTGKKNLSLRPVRMRRATGTLSLSTVLNCTGAGAIPSPCAGAHGVRNLSLRPVLVARGRKTCPSALSGAHRVGAPNSPPCVQAHNGADQISVPHCLGAVDGGNAVMHRHTACGQGAVEVLQCTAILPRGTEE